MGNKSVKPSKEKERKHRERVRDTRWVAEGKEALAQMWEDAGEYGYSAKLRAKVRSARLHLGSMRGDLEDE